jgi:hypothetical protein
MGDFEKPTICVNRHYVFHISFKPVEHFIERKKKKMVIGVGPSSFLLLNNDNNQVVAVIFHALLKSGTQISLV